MGIPDSEDFNKNPNILPGDRILTRTKIQRDNTIGEVLHKMRKSKHNELPVFNDEEFCGVICKDDIIEYLNSTANKLITEVKLKEEEPEGFNTVKDKFLSIIAHDLKNQFNCLVGFSRILLEEHNYLESDKREQFLSVIFKSIKNTNDLLENLLIWARNHSGEIPFNPEKLNLNTRIKRNLTLIKECADIKNIALESFLSNEYYIYADKDMLNAVLRNLLTNAVKFTESGGKIFLSVSDKNGFAEIMITDTGIGISQEDIAKLFNESVSFSSIGTDKEKGSGLGLIICKEFVKRNEGELLVESKLGKGTVFRFTVPIYFE